MGEAPIWSSSRRFGNSAMAHGAGPAPIMVGAQRATVTRARIDCRGFASRGRPTSEIDALGHMRRHRLARKCRKNQYFALWHSLCSGTAQEANNSPGVRIRTGRDAHSSPRGLFFARHPRCPPQAPNSQGNAGKQAIYIDFSSEQTLTRRVHCHAHGGRPGVRIPTRGYTCTRPGRAGRSDPKTQGDT